MAGVARRGATCAPTPLGSLASPMLLCWLSCSPHRRVLSLMEPLRWACSSTLGSARQKARRSGVHSSPAVGRPDMMGRPELSEACFTAALKSAGPAVR